MSIPAEQKQSYEELERELAAVRGQLEESAKTGLKYMAQAAEETRRADRAESALAAKADPALAERLRELIANAPAYSLTSPIKSDDWRDEAVRVMHLAADALGEEK